MRKLILSDTWEQDGITYGTVSNDRGFVFGKVAKLNGEWVVNRLDERLFQSSDKIRKLANFLDEINH